MYLLSKNLKLKLTMRQLICICQILIHGEFSRVSSNCLPLQMSRFFLMWHFKCFLKLLAWIDAYRIVTLNAFEGYLPIRSSREFPQITLWKMVTMCSIYKKPPPPKAGSGWAVVGWRLNMWEHGCSSRLFHRREMRTSSFSYHKHRGRPYIT